MHGSYQTLSRPRSAHVQQTWESTHRLGLERVQRLGLGTHVVRLRLEVRDDLLSLRNDRLVLRNESVLFQPNTGPHAHPGMWFRQPKSHPRMVIYAAMRMHLPARLVYIP